MVIEALGGRGDGLARHDGRRLAVAGALPGERHRVRYDAATAGTVAAESVDRIQAVARAEPVCRHFAACGGCVAQHLPLHLYRSWKLDRVATALARHGIDVPVALVHASPPASRRRLRVAVVRTGRGPVVGFHERRSRRVVDVTACPIAHPALIATLPPLRALVAGLDRPPGEVELTSYDAGIEVVGRGDPPGLADRERLAAWAGEHDLARVAWRSEGAPAETIAERRRPLLSWPTLEVAPPPAAFLQATAAAEACLQSAVTDALAGTDRVLDLYAGVGTFSAAARATGARVAAVEGDAAAAAALHAAGVPTVVRDLERRPLVADELAAFDAAVLDPPRRGASAQTAELARSAVDRIVYVACDAASFARDAALLLAHGFVLGDVQVVDQFRFAAEVELIGCFDRRKGP